MTCYKDVAPDGAGRAERRRVRRQAALGSSVICWDLCQRLPAPPLPLSFHLLCANTGDSDDSKMNIVL